MERKKRNYLLAAGVLIVLIIGGNYSYRADKSVRENGIYSIATITSIKIARNGWKVIVVYPYMDILNTGEGLNDIKDFDMNDLGKRYFIKFQKEHPNGNHVLIPTVKVPDSIQSAPLLGWSEAWMNVHFPEVVEYVHDTR